MGSWPAPGALAARRHQEKQAQEELRFQRMSQARPAVSRESSLSFHGWHPVSDVELGATASRRRPGDPAASVHGGARRPQPGHLLRPQPLAFLGLLCNRLFLGNWKSRRTLGGSVLRVLRFCSHLTSALSVRLDKTLLFTGSSPSSEDHVVIQSPRPSWRGPSRDPQSCPWEAPAPGCSARLCQRPRAEGQWEAIGLAVCC